MRKTRAFCLTAVFAASALLSTELARASLIEQFDFAGNTGSETSVSPYPASEAPGLTGSDISRGSGFNAATGASGFASVHSAAYATTAAAALTAGEYNAFSITPTAGNAVQLDNIKYSGWVQNGKEFSANMNASTNFDTALEYSLDGIHFTLVTPTNNYTGTGNPTGNMTGAAPILYTADLSGINALQTDTGTVYFDIVFFGANFDVKVGFGTETGNAQDLLVNGAIIPTPEPASLGLLGIGALGLLKHRRTT